MSQKYDYDFEHFCHQQCKRVEARLFGSREIKRVQAKERRKIEEGNWLEQWTFRGLVSGSFLSK